MKKKVLLVSGDITCGLTWQRGHIFFRHLTDEFDIVPLSWHQLDKVHPMYADVIVLLHPYVEEHAHAIMRWKGHYGVPVVVDTDDLISNLPSDHPEFPHFKHSAINKIVLFADAVTVSTETLKRTYAHLNKEIKVIPNCIDERRYQHLGVNYSVDTKPYHQGFIVGWTGGQSHRPDMMSQKVGFIDGLKRLMRKYNDVRAYFHVLCPQELIDEFGVRVTYNETVVDFLDVPALYYSLPFDVCCVPLQNHPFNQAKSDLRIVDMAPFNIPCCASPVDDFAAHEKDKRVVLAPDGEWFHALEWCYNFRKELREIGQRAREYVYKERLSRVVANRWRALLRGVCLKGPSMEQVNLYSGTSDTLAPPECGSDTPSRRRDKEAPESSKADEKSPVTPDKTDEADQPASPDRQA